MTIEYHKVSHNHRKKHKSQRCTSLTSRSPTRFLSFSGFCNQSMTPPQTDRFSALSPDVLVPIFSSLGDSNQIVVSRRTCRKFLDVINNNRSLWRSLKWTQKGTEDPFSAIDMFDEKSRSTMEEVSIEGSYMTNWQLIDLSPLFDVLQKSSDTLVSFSFSIRLPRDAAKIEDQVTELALSCSSLRSLVFWNQTTQDWLPVARLVPGIKEKELSSSRRETGLEVLWWSCPSVHNIKGKLWTSQPLSSLKSFANLLLLSPEESHPLLSKFCKTIVRMSLRLGSGEDQAPLEFPNLQVLEISVQNFPSWMICPNLETLVMEELHRSALRDLPINIQELWLVRRHLGIQGSSFDSQDWIELADSCPQLRILKVTESFFRGSNELNPLFVKSFLEALKIRRSNSEKGMEVQGFILKSLEKLVVPFNRFTSSQIEELQDSVEEVIEIEHYPNFIEVQY